MLAIDLELGWLRSDKLTKLWLIFENAVIAPMKIGVIFPGPTNAKNAIASFHVILLSAGNVGFWLAKGAGGTDSKMLHLRVGGGEEVL